MVEIVELIIVKMVTFISFLLPPFDYWNSKNFWVYLFWGHCIHRYLRLLVHCVSHWSYKSKSIPAKPTFTSKDVTVIIPTIHNAFEELRPCLLSILACGPAELMLVTTHNRLSKLEAFAKSINHPDTSVFSSGIANKRLQVCEALPKLKTAMTILADDDVIWPSTLIPWILAPFEDLKIGGVGTNQRVRREPNASWSTQI